MISLHVEQLSKSFGQNRIWHNISFDHKKGALGIAGPNGSGKSTLLKCLAGLLQSSSGTVIWKNDHMIVKAEDIKQRIGFAAPYVTLYREFSVIENIHFLSNLRKDTFHHVSIHDLLIKLELDHVAEKSFGNLSTGQQQRARLAAALFTDPEVLMLDEPGSNLDKQGRNLIKYIVNQAKNEKKLVILASNNQEELALCDHIFSFQE